MANAGYLREIAPGSNPMLYERGPRAALMDRLIGPPDSDQGGWSTPLVGRVHRQDFKWRTAGPPSRQAAWVHKWHASKVPMFQAEVAWGGKRFTVHEARGPKKTSLTVYCPEEWVMDPGEASEIQRNTMDEAAQVLRAFAKEHGYELVGQLQPLQPAEVGFSAPELPKMGRPGQGPVHVDGSGHDGNELEAQMGPAAKSFLGLPRFQEGTDRRLSALERFWSMERATRERMAKIAEDQAAVSQADRELLLGLMEAQATQVAKALGASAPRAPSPSSSSSPYDGGAYT